ncbi:MAG: hypothetical protein GY700_15590 [Propionibacteriaceae bacterium]|nr:hypothetical protein [Propionibacteriaceae bacterium]
MADAAQDLLVVPLRDPLRHHTQDEMDVVGHNRVSTHVDGEEGAQQPDALDDPGLAVVEIAPGILIIATEGGKARRTQRAMQW